MGWGKGGLRGRGEATIAVFMLGLLLCPTQVSLRRQCALVGVHGNGMGRGQAQLLVELVALVDCLQVVDALLAQLHHLGLRYDSL